MTFKQNRKPAENQPADQIVPAPQQNAPADNHEPAANNDSAAGGAAMELQDHEHDKVDFNLAKLLLPPGVGAGLYLAKDGRWKIQMRNMAGAGSKTRSWSSNFAVRSDHEAFKFLLTMAWEHYKSHGGTAAPPKLG